MGWFTKSQSKEVDQINACIERIARLERTVRQHQQVIERIGKYVKSDIDTPWMQSAKELVAVINDIPKV